MKYVTFTEKEKCEMFDEMAQKFYHANFGQASKADIELLMFHFYLKKIICDNLDKDGTIDYNKCSDYKISKELGITQQRVRNLKIKNHLIYPIDFQWEHALAKLTEKARYDKESKKVCLNIPDPNLYLEIQNFIEEHGAYIEKQLNSKVLQIRAEYYIDLILHLEPDESRKRIVKKLKSHFEAEGKDDTAFDEKKIGKSLIDLGTNAITLVELIAPEFSVTNCIAKSLISLLTKR